MSSLNLVDADTGISYILQVTPEVAEKAQNDLAFATSLLRGAIAHQKTTENNDSARELESSSPAPECGDEGTECPIGNVVPDNVEEDEGETDLFRWKPEAIRCLLSSYKSREDAKSAGKLSAKKFWELISKDLQEKNVIVSGPQCKSKINGMLKVYKKVKDHNGKSGNARKEYVYFKEIDSIFGKKPWAEPVKVFESDAPETQACTESLSGYDSSCSENRPAKRKANTTADKLLSAIEESAAKREAMHKESMAKQDQFLKLFQQLVEKS